MSGVTAEVGARNDKARMLWRCRRGMLELDLLLQPFVERHFDALTTEEQLQFLSLLDMQDQPLLDCLMLQEEPEDPDLSAMIAKIRDAV